MNQSVINFPCYNARRIGTLKALCSAIGEPRLDLQDLLTRSDALYREVPIEKPDGTLRVAYDALTPLKQIQRKIKTRILDRVVYPSYLTGSIKQRDYKRNAELHLGARIVINEDIEGFFPSTSAAHVFNIWRKFFGFSEEVAQCLTSLTTRHDQLPQGAGTSSYLANLVFWRDEPRLYAAFSEQNLPYSRYVDDITISSKQFLTDKEKTQVIGQVYAMLRKHGYRPKRAKHEIASSGRRMAVTKLSVNHKPGVDKSKRSQLRAAVHQIEQRFAAGETLPSDHGIYAQTLAQVRQLERFHPGKGSILKNRLLALKEGHRH